MKQLENFFKTRKEVESFFKDEVFKFSFISDNIAYFESLTPRLIDEDYIRFELGFYFESGKDFFAYSSLTTWLDSMQLSKVTGIYESTNERVEMFFHTFVSFKDN
jgi:hypothetical protein